MEIRKILLLGSSTLFVLFLFVPKPALAATFNVYGYEHLQNYLVVPNIDTGYIAEVALPFVLYASNTRSALHTPCIAAGMSETLPLYFRAYIYGANDTKITTGPSRDYTGDTMDDYPAISSPAGLTTGDDFNFVFRIGHGGNNEHCFLWDVKLGDNTSWLVGEPPANTPSTTVAIASMGIVLWDQLAANLYLVFCFLCVICLIFWTFSRIKRIVWRR